jgi:hypothetical protein
MSIEVLIQQCIAQGRLHSVLPALPFVPTSRVIYVTTEIKQFIDSADARAGAFHADLDSFSAGDRITGSMLPGRAKTAYMGLLDPVENGIWDIRSRDPSPALRMLGGFARRDAFIGLTLYFRAPLGGIGSREWSQAITQTRTEWRNRFSSYEPLTGDNLHDLLSNASCVD